MSRLIDADKMLEKFNKQADIYEALTDKADDFRLFCKLADAVEDAPTVDAVPVVHGEWSIAIGYDPNKAVLCSECQKMNYEPTVFCPHCGAKMDGERREE